MATVIEVKVDVVIIVYHYCQKMKVIRKSWDKKVLCSGMLYIVYHKPNVNVSEYPFRKTEDFSLEAIIADVVEVMLEGS